MRLAHVLPVNDKSFIAMKTQCENWAAPWAHLRDHAKPIAPRDVDELREVREMLPPSKAHIKRLQRERPVVVVAKPKVSRPDGQRLAHVEMQAVRKSVLVAAGQARKPYVAHPLPRKPLPDVPPSSPASADKTFIANNKAERDHMVALSKMVYANFQPDEARILRVFGSVEAWERAKRV